MTQPNEQLIETIQNAVKQFQLHGYDKAWDIATSHNWLRTLLEENKRLADAYDDERASHNSHVTELIETERDLDEVREERDYLHAQLMDVESQLQQTREAHNITMNEVSKFEEMYEDERAASNQLTAELEQVKTERDKYHEEAMNERELSEDIVGEREQLYLELSAKNKALETVMRRCKDARAYESAAYAYHEAFKVMQQYPREKGADDEQR